MDNVNRNKNKYKIHLKWKKRVHCLCFYVMFCWFNYRLDTSEFKVGRKKPQNKSNDNNFDILKLLYNNSTTSSCWYQAVGAGLYQTLCWLNYGLYRASLLAMTRIVLSLYHFHTGSPVRTSCSSTRSTTGWWCFYFLQTTCFPQKFTSAHWPVASPVIPIIPVAKMTMIWMLACHANPPAPHPSLQCNVKDQY